MDLPWSAQASRRIAATDLRACRVQAPLHIVACKWHPVTKDLRQAKFYHPERGDFHPAVRRALLTPAAVTNWTESDTALAHFSGGWQQVQGKAKAVTATARKGIAALFLQTPAAIALDLSGFPARLITRNGYRNRVLGNSQNGRAKSFSGMICKNLPMEG